MSRDRRFEDLWADAANDGASSPIGVNSNPFGAELEDLMDAWFDERTQRIEGLLVLEQARRMIVRLMSEAGGSPTSRRRASQLVRAIRKLQAEGG